MKLTKIFNILNSLPPTVSHSFSLYLPLTLTYYIPSLPPTVSHSFLHYSHTPPYCIPILNSLPLYYIPSLPLYYISILPPSPLTIFIFFLSYPLMEIYKEIILGHDPIDLKIEKISKLFDSDEFIPFIFFDDDFLNTYIPFSTLVLNSIESNEIRVFILTSLNKFTFKTIQNEEFVLALHRVLEEDNFHNVILTLKIFASLLKINIKSDSPNRISSISKPTSVSKPLSPKKSSPSLNHPPGNKPSPNIKHSPGNKPSPNIKHSPNIKPSLSNSLLDKHISVIVDLINSVFLKLDNFDEATVDTTFFTLSQIFGYVSDVIQRQPQTEKKIEGIVHRTVSFFRLFLEHRRVIDLTKYNKSFALEMISTLSKLFKIFSDSPLFNTRNDALNSTIFELSKFSLFYCPTDAIDLRKELFYYIFKILLKNKEMYLPKIEEFFDIRFFYLDESFLINIKGLIGLTDLALVFSGNLSRRVPHELQRRTSEILESNLMMVHEKLKKCKFEDLENEDHEEVKLNYEKSLKFHLEIVYECVNLIYKQTTIAEKFSLQKAEFIDFCYKQFLLVSQVIESLKKINKVKNGINEDGVNVDVNNHNVNILSLNPSNNPINHLNLSLNNNLNPINNNLNTINNNLNNNITTTHLTHFSILKSTFLSLSKPLKEIADSLTALLKNNVEVAFPMADLFSAFKGVLEILEFSDFDEKDGQFINEILLFFFTPFGGSVHLDFITGLISQMFAAPFFMKIYLSILKRVPNLQMVVTEIVYQLISMLTQDKSKIHNFKKSIYSSKRLSYPEMVDLYEPVFDFIADIYNYNPSFISKKTMYALVNFLSRMISSQDIEDHRLLLFLLGTFNVKNDKSGSLHVYFYKKLHVFVRDFFSNYMLTLDPLYLDIIFSFPININAITLEWAFLLNPIRCALRLKDDISVKAISAFIHIIEASKGEIITGGNKWQIEDLFREIYDLLDDQRFTISCSQLLGRLKSYHKNYLTGSFYFNNHHHYVFNQLVNNHSNLCLENNHNNLCLENLVLKAIEFLKGKIVFDETKPIFDINDILIFKKTLPEVNKNLEGEEAAFVIICEYINEKIKESGKEIYDNPVFLYDAIISLFQCSEGLNYKVEIFLKQIYEVAPLSTINGTSPYSLNGNILLRVLLESFGESRFNLTCELFYSLLTRIPSENLTGVLKEIISYFLTIRNGKMSRAAFRGLSSILQWEKLPNLIIKEDLRRILDGLAFHMGKMGFYSFSNDSLAGISALVRKADNLNCVCSVFKWAIDRITFGKPGDKAEMVFCEETLKMLFLKYENLFSNIFMEKIRGFFYTSNDLRDVDVFYTKVALFIFFVKNTCLFLEKETIVLVKTYFYYMFSCNFLIFSASQEIFLTNLAIKSSDKFRVWERNLMKRGDLIRFLFYELPKDNSEFYDMFDHSLNLPLDVNEDERLYYYLSNEIIYMHLAFTKEKEIATVPFNIAFHNLPFGLIAPLKMLLMTNKSIITELLLEKYEECFNSTLSVQVVEKMITIFSVIKMKEDEKLYNFILKVFEEYRTPVEGLLLAENPETSILAKTFELSLLYPDQTHLHRSVLRVAYPWLHEASRNYTAGISKAMLEYVENYSNLCFPLLVREVVDESMFKLVENIFENSIAFKNYVNNNQYIINSVHVDESMPLSLNSISFFLKFLRLVEYEVTPLQIKAAIRAYGECKLQNKPTKDIKDFLRFAINRFTENDLTLLFKTDPLLKLGGACNVKMFKGISSKSLLGCLLKSVSKADIKAFENLIRFYGDQSWMLVEMFVDCKFYSPRMIEYCKSNLGNGNIRSYLLYYLCTFEPLPEYFEALLGLSYEERKYTLYSLRKVVEKYNDNNNNEDLNIFETIILSYIKSEIQYKTNIHILYPLLAKTHSLITKDIARVLCGVVYRLLNTFIQFHQKIGTLLFDALYSFYGPSSTLGNLYNLLVLNYFYSKKSDMTQFILKYDLVLSPEFINIYFYTDNRVDGSLEFTHVAAYMEHVINLNGPQEVVQFLFKIIKKEWYKYPLNETTVSYLYTTIISGDLILLKEMHKTTLLNILRVAKEKNSINWKQCLPTIKGLVQDAGQTYATIFQLFCDYSIYLPPTTPYFVDFICGCMNKESKNKPQGNLNHAVSFINQILFDLLLDIKTPVPFKIALFALLNQKFTSIFQEEDFFNLTLSFFLKYRLAQPGSLSSLNELLYRGCTHPSPGIRTKFIQFLDEILPGDPQGRLVDLLEFDWSGCNKTQIPFIFTILLLGCYDTSEIRMFNGSSALNYDSISSSLENFLFISPDSSLPLLHEIISKFGLSSKSSKNQLTSNLIAPLIIEMSPFVNDSLTYVLLKATGCPENVDYSKIKAGHLSFFEILNETKCNLSMYRETGIKDYVYGCLRATAKFPEVMQASVFQQFGKFKEAQKIYENLQSECVGSKVSFYEDEYENICREWVECTKELQQWDVLYTIGNNIKGNKKGSDHTLIPSLKPIFNSLTADSLFFLSNFNLSNERETFQGVVGVMSKGISKALYELFHSIYQAPSSENFVDLIIQIIKKMASGPRNKEFNFYYSNLIQIVLEMHDTTSLFTFGAEAEERINGLSYAWEDREPLIEGPYEVLSMFSTWRRHFFRRIECYSNEGTLINENEADEGDPRKSNISTNVNKTKEYSEAISKLRKTMYIKGNNELGRNANFLALAAYKKGYYDNALFLLKEVFELPSIKILDAYRKVVYELMCFYDMNENKLGLDLANSTNIVHFSDEQSSNIFRMRGMFSERIKDVEETKKIYFQAIQFFSSPENHFYYTNLLLKHFDYADVQDEVVSSCLQGLSISDSPYSKHLIMSLLLLLENHSVNYNLSLFKSLVKSVNVAYFVAFIPRMRKIQNNVLYLRLIFDELMKKFPEAVVLNELTNKKIVRVKMTDNDKIDKNVNDLDNKVNSIDNNEIKNNKETEDNENKDITRPVSSSHNNPQDFKFLKSILSGLREVFRLDEPAQDEVEMIEILNAFINHIVDSITDINTLPYLDQLIELSESIHYDLDLKHNDSLSLTDVVLHLDAILKNLKNKLKTPSLLINKEKLDTVNKILTERRLPLFGSFSKIQKDYSNVVCVESFDSYRVLRKEKNKKEVFLIGSDGRYYKYEININKECTGLPLLYHVLALEINNCYHLRSRDAFLHLVSTQEIGPNLHVDVFDVNALSFEEITDKHPHDHLVEFVREYEKMCLTEPKDENSPCENLEKNIIRLLKPEKIIKNKTKRVLLTDFFKSLKKDWSLPKINGKLRLKVYFKVLPLVSKALPTFLRSTSDSSFSFFMQKYAFSKSFALNLSINNFLKIKTKDPRNDAIEMYTGLFLRKNLEYSSAGDSLYISPGIQELIGIENLEGPFLSCLFLSSAFFLKNESFDLIMRYFDFDAVYAKEILKKVVSVEGNDHEIIKIVSGWTDVNLISRNKVSENVWN